MKCTECGKNRNASGAVFNRHALNVHMARVHGTKVVHETNGHVAVETSADAPPPPALVCPKCGKKYKDTSALRVHMTRWCGREVVAKKKSHKAKLPTEQREVKFCPCCGLNLSLMQAALNVAGV